MWTGASFCIYLLLYLNKYLPGTIFLNYYLEGATGAIGYLIAAPLYKYLKIRISFIISFVLTLLGSIGILLFETEAISPYFIDDCGAPPSPYPHGSKKDKDYHLK